MRSVGLFIPVSAPTPRMHGPMVDTVTAVAWKLSGAWPSRKRMIAAVSLGESI